METIEKICTFVVVGLVVMMTPYELVRFWLWLRRIFRTGGKVVTVVEQPEVRVAGTRSVDRSQRVDRYSGEGERRHSPYMPISLARMAKETPPDLDDLPSISDI